MYCVIKCVKTKRVLKGIFASSVFHSCNAKKNANLRHRSAMCYVSNGFGPSGISMNLSHLNRPFLPLKPDSDTWEFCPMNKVLERWEGNVSMYLIVDWLVCFYLLSYVGDVGVDCG
jgi:hypothetical protein